MTDKPTKAKPRRLALAQPLKNADNIDRYTYLGEYTAGSGVII